MGNILGIKKRSPKYQKSFWEQWFENDLTVSDDFMIERSQSMPQQREDIYP